MALLVLTATLPNGVAVIIFWNHRRTVWRLPYYLVLRGFVWVDASAKMPTWQRRHSLRACLPDQAGGASEGAPPARRGG